MYILESVLYVVAGIGGTVLAIRGSRRLLAWQRTRR